MLICNVASSSPAVPLEIFSAQLCPILKVFPLKIDNTWNYSAEMPQGTLGGTGISSPSVSNEGVLLYYCNNSFTALSPRGMPCGMLKLHQKLMHSTRPDSCARVWSTRLYADIPTYLMHSNSMHLNGCKVTGLS